MFARLVLLLHCWAVAKAVQYTVSSSEIKEVSIGGRISEVSRSFTLESVPKGFHTIVVDHVPSTVDEKSIQVAGTGAAEVISTILHKQVIFREDDARFAELSAKLDVTLKYFTGEVQALNLEKKRIAQRIDSWNMYAQNVLKPDAASKATPVSLEQLTEILNYEEKTLTEQNRKLVEVDARIACAQKTVITLQQMIEGLRVGFQYRNLFFVEGEPPLSISAEHLKVLQDLPKESSLWPAKQKTREVRINIHVPSDTSGGNKLTFAFEYMTSPAYWMAEYDIRLQSHTKDEAAPTTVASVSDSGEYELRIGLYGVVAQETQEDWRDVMLHLSTAQPQPNIYSPAPPARLSISYQPEFQQPNSPPRMQHKRSRGGYADISMAKFAGAPVMESMAMDSGISAGSASFAEMDVAGVGMTGSGGNMGAAVVFSPKYPVNITSNHRAGGTFQSNGRMAVPVDDTTPTRSTRLFIKETVLVPSLFTYNVPTVESGAFLKAWTTGSASAATASDAMPLLESPTGRVFIDDTYTGTTSVPSTQPGAALRLDLGQDRNVEVKSTFVLPRKGSETEDKSTWFVTDKVKYKVEVAEYAFTVHSTHSAPHLVVLSEYLPHVGDEGIKVELLQPAPESTLQVKSPQGDGADQDVWNEQDFIAAVLAHPSLKVPTSTPNTANKADTMAVFYSKGSNNIAWAQWVQPGQTVKAGLKYRIVYPDGKNINRVHY